MSEHFQVCISDESSPHLLVARSTILRSLAPWQLRDEDTQAAYTDHVRRCGPGIVPGWQENWYPYTKITDYLSDETGNAWSHFVFAREEGVSLPLLPLVAHTYGCLHGLLYFINPPHLQSQPHIPHGHVVAELKRYM